MLNCRYSKESEMATVEGQPVKIGDWVSFKADTEQMGRIVHISEDGRGLAALTLENLAGFHGDYIGGQIRTVVRSDDCWVE